MREPYNGAEIAVVGMAGRYPKSRSLDQFWDHLRNGEELITFFSREELEQRGVDKSILDDSHFVRAAAVIEDVEMFDASFFGFLPREAELLDPQHRLFLECAWEALENAGYCAEQFKGLISVFAGTGINTYFMTNLLTNPRFGPLDQLQLLLGSDKDYMMTRVSYKLNLKGPSVMVSSACSTSLVAIHLACQSLLNEECDMALAGASTVQVRPHPGYYAFEGGIYSPDGRCRSFDAAGRGTIFGNGVGVVVLKRLEDALTDGDHIEAVIIGSAVNNDGANKVSYTAPSVEGQSEVIAEAVGNAGVSADTISYIEAHGTATPLGDSIEIQALTRAFGATTERKQFCAVGSVKSNLGHLDAAAGVTGFIKTVLCLKNRMLAPSLHVELPNPAIDFANSPFWVNSELSDWNAPYPRRAGVSSFGIGGTNAHIIVEEAPIAEPFGASRANQLLVLSAKSVSALRTATESLTQFLKKNRDTNPADVAYTLQLGRKRFSHRSILVCNGVDDALSALEADDQIRVVTEFHESGGRPVVFMFPGQGSQHPNMGRGLYESERVYRDEIDRCADLLMPELGFDIRALMFSGDNPAGSEELARTAAAQPALFAVEYALAQLWRSWGVRPWAMIGHSIGELVAACLGEVFSLEDATKLVAVRGRLMQSLSRGAMLAVSVSEQEIQPFLGSGVEIAAVNAVNRCVLSGPYKAISAVETAAIAAGHVCSRLRTSHAFHSAMMDPIVKAFADEVARLKLRAPRIPYISNVTGEWITADQATDPNYWADHIRFPVRFGDGLAELLKEPSALLLEVGPGQALGALAKLSPDRGSDHAVISSMRRPSDVDADESAITKALGRLWLQGLEIDWRSYYGGERRRRVALPTYPFERTRCWIDPGARPAQRPTHLMESGGAHKAVSTSTNGARALSSSDDSRSPAPALIGAEAESVAVHGLIKSERAAGTATPGWSPSGNGNGGAVVISARPGEIEKGTVRSNGSRQSSSAEGIVSRQLRIMARQLDILGAKSRKKA